MKKDFWGEFFWNKDEIIPGDCVYFCRYDLRHKNVMQSAELTVAARDGEWQKVRSLLEQGADPRICRCSDNVNTCSPLFYAIAAGQYGIANQLYDAGDRLDDIHIEGGKIPDEFFNFIQWQLKFGRNFLFDESRPLSGCVRCLQLERCRELIANATAEELALSVRMLVGIQRGSNAELFFDVAKLLKEHGADFAPCKQDFLNYIECMKKWPAVIRGDRDTFMAIEDFFKNI